MLLGSSHVVLGQPARLDESDALATALGYKHDATKVDVKKFPTYAAGRNCANCELFQGAASAAWAGCGAVGGRHVNAKGWCVAWAKKG
jgi:hypothetical protein